MRRVSRVWILTQVPPVTFGDVSGLVDGGVEGDQFVGDVTHPWAVVDAGFELVAPCNELRIGDTGNGEALVCGGWLDHGLGELTNQDVNVALGEGIAVDVGAFTERSGASLIHRWVSPLARDRAV